ncbi:MAG: hypothetical protein ROR55_19760 [Devosia sp.]
MTDTPRPKKAALVTTNAGFSPIVPKDTEEIVRMAKMATAAGFKPSNPKVDPVMEATWIIAAGLEKGIPPMTALGVIAVINGKIRLYGEGPMMLIHRSGLLSWKKEWVDGDGDELVAHCEVHRVGDPPDVTTKRSFSVSDAKVAGLWDTRDRDSYGKPNKAPWRRYPKRMLAARARGYALADAFSDVLAGMEQRDVVDDPEVEPTDTAEPEAKTPTQPQLVNPLVDEFPLKAEAVEAEFEATE